MATIVISGRLTEDIKQGENCCFFTVAESKRRNPDEANYYNCIANVSEKQQQHLLKGKSVIVTGDLDIERVEKNGVKYTNVNVLVYDVRFNGTSKTTENETTEPVNDSETE